MLDLDSNLTMTGTTIGIPRKMNVGGLSLGKTTPWWQQFQTRVSTQNKELMKHVNIMAECLFDACKKDPEGKWRQRLKRCMTELCSHNEDATNRKLMSTPKRENIKCSKK